MLRNYEILFWWIGIKVTFARTDSNLIKLCKFLTETNKPKGFEEFAAELSKYYDGLLVLECIKDSPKNADTSITKRIHSYYNQKRS